MAVPQRYKTLYVCDESGLSTSTDFSDFEKDGVTVKPIASGEISEKQTEVTDSLQAVSFALHKQ